MAMTPVETYPIADWMLVTGKGNEKTSKACLVARNFDSGIMLAITQKASGNISLGFNFRKDVLTLNKTHYVALSTDTGYNKLYQIKTVSPREIILDLPHSIHQENPLPKAREIYMNIEGLHSYKFSLSDIDQGLDKLTACLGPHVPPKTTPSAPAPQQHLSSGQKTQGLNPDSFTDVLNNLTLQKSAPSVKIPATLPERKKIEATPVLETRQIKEPPVTEEMAKEDFSYTPPSFFSPKTQNLQKAADITENKPVISEAQSKKPVPGSIAAMEQRMQDAKEGKFPSPPAPAQPVTAKEAEIQEEVSEDLTETANNEEDVTEIEDADPLDEEASMEEVEIETAPVPVEPIDQTASSNEYMDPELVESLVQKIKLLEIEKESLRDRLHEYEIDNKIINEIKPDDSTK